VEDTQEQEHLQGDIQELVLLKVGIQVLELLQVVDTQELEHPLVVDTQEQELLQELAIQEQELLQVVDIQVQELLQEVATQEQALLLEVAIREQEVQDIQEQLLPLIQQWPSGSRPWTRTTVVRLTPRSSARPSPTAT